MQKRQIVLMIVTAVMLVSSCAPTKNTATRRFYHNLVSRYNIYYNGREALKQGQVQLNTNHKDDYTEILSLMKYGTEQDANAIIPLMDRTSEKGSKVVLKHSMNFGGVEYNRWVDDSYMMIGKSRFFKHDYLGAIEMFDFVSKRFTNNPIRYDALLWMAKAYMYSGRLHRCDVLFGMIEPQLNNKDISKYVKRNFPIIRAQYFILTGNLEEASVYLDKALKENQLRRVKIRTTFIAGQVNQKLGRDQKALEYYQACIKLNPPYEMAFYAKIFSAECYDAAAGGGDNILKELHKMLKDSKNKDYFDVIYYALANIEIKNNNTPKAIEYLQMSARSSINNDLQKGLSYRKLAEIHFEKKKYKETKLYYDSTLMALPKTHRDYIEIEKKAVLMADLIDNLYTIELQDSLQKLAGMSERDRFAVIDKIIADLIRAEEEEKERERQRQLAAMQQQDPNMQMTMAPGSAWYFYNPSAVNYGKTEFMRIWGERKLEDLWRLQNKEVSVFGDFDEYVEENEDEITDSIKKLNNPKERAYYLKDIPDTPERITESNRKIEVAYYKAGTIYKDDLKDLPPAIEMFETLLKRYPETEYELKSLYNLYLINNNMNNSSQVAKYKDLIMSKYPESDIALIINDPDYYKKIAEQASEAKLHYKTTWELYQDKQWTTVISKCDEGLEKFNDPEIRPKYEYLKAISLGKTSGNEEMIEQLEHIVANYSQSDVKPLAEQLLAYLKGEPLSIGTDTDPDGQQPDTGPLFKPSPDSYHLFVLIVDVKTTNLNTLKSNLSDHNIKFHSTQNLTVSTLFLNDRRHLLTVSRFNDQTDAERYFKVFSGNSELLFSIQNDFPVYFVISTDNYPVFYKDKDEQAYLEFFRRYYLAK